MNIERYQRQMQLPEIGWQGQLRLQQARVLIVGAGGLGCPALQYLAAAGVGHIGIADGDRVECSNLHRQTLYSDTDTGALKALVAVQKLRALNPDIEVIPYPFEVTGENAEALVKNYDLVIDGTDRFATRYLLSDICFLQQKPYVFGAVSRYEGQVAVFCVPDPHTGIRAQYRDLCPTPPDPGAVPDCANNGVLGVLPGLIGMWQATEALLLLTGVGQPLINKVLVYQLLSHRQYIFDIGAPPRPN